jgi:hypothetical protein
MMDEQLQRQQQPAKSVLLLSDVAAVIRKRHDAKNKNNAKNAVAAAAAAVAAVPKGAKKR